MGESIAAIAAERWAEAARKVDSQARAVTVAMSSAVAMIGMNGVIGPRCAVSAMASGMTVISRALREGTAVKVAAMKEQADGVTIAARGGLKVRAVDDSCIAVRKVACSAKVVGTAKWTAAGMVGVEGVRGGMVPAVVARVALRG